MKERPNCVNCGKPLGKDVNTVRVPFDRDVDVCLHEQLKGREYQMMDAYATVCHRQQEASKQYDKRLEQMKEARLRLAPGSNEPPAATMLDKFRRDLIKSQAEEPDRSHYDVTVRIWMGRYGPDRRGLFHSQACAQDWANRIAGRLRKKGEV